MPLDATARERLADVRELAPTTNGELADRWGMDSGKDVAANLRDHLDGQVYRGEDKKLRTRNGGAPAAAGGGGAGPEPDHADADDTDGTANRRDDPHPRGPTGPVRRRPRQARRALAAASL